MRDALEFAALAIAKAKYAASHGCFARSLADADSFIADNPYCEVTFLVSVSSTEVLNGGVLELTLFRRTWCNNIYLDYLTTHPELKRAAGVYVSGVGLALLHFATKTASKLGSRRLWGESTQNSYMFYKKFLRLRSVRDIISAPKKNIILFNQWMEDKKRDALLALK